MYQKVNKIMQILEADKLLIITWNHEYLVQKVSHEFLAELFKQKIKINNIFNFLN